MRKILARYPYRVVIISLCLAWIPLSYLTMIALYFLLSVFGVKLSDGNQGKFEVVDVAGVVSFLLVALLIVYGRAYASAPEPVTGARLRVQGFLLVAECVGSGLLMTAMSKGVDLIAPAFTGSGLSLLITGLLVVSRIQALRSLAPTSAPASSLTCGVSESVCAPPAPTLSMWRGKRCPPRRGRCARLVGLTGGHLRHAPFRDHDTAR
jgi:hypothetical protein